MVGAVRLCNLLAFAVGQCQTSIAAERIKPDVAIGAAIDRRAKFHPRGFLGRRYSSILDADSDIPR